MRSYEEIRQSLRRQAIAKLCALGLVAVVAATAMLYGLWQGGRAIWAALTRPKTLVVQLAPATPPARTSAATSNEPHGCPFHCSLDCPEHRSWHELQRARRAYQRAQRRARRYAHRHHRHDHGWPHEHWSW